MNIRRSKPDFVNYERWDDARYLMALMKFKRFEIIRGYHHQQDYSKSPYYIVEPVPSCNVSLDRLTELTPLEHSYMSHWYKQAWKQRISTDVAERIIASKYIRQCGFGKWRNWQWDVKKFPPKGKTG